MSDGSQAMWTDAEAYEDYIGRWSRPVAAEFLDWLGVPPQGDWLDIGCGTGALTGAILERCAPDRVDAFDLSPSFIEYARAHIGDRRVEFRIGDACALPSADASVDAAVTGLSLNAFPDPAKAVAELARCARPSAVVAAYVWDFDGGMELLRLFWESANELDPEADRDRNNRGFALCDREPLAALFSGAGLRDVEVRAIDGRARFTDFDDYWRPFLRGGAPGQVHVASLDEPRRARLRQHLRERLPIASDGSISLLTRAWAVKGTV